MRGQTFRNIRQVILPPSNRWIDERRHPSNRHRYRHPRNRGLLDHGRYLALRLLLANALDSRREHRVQKCADPSLQL